MESSNSAFKNQECNITPSNFNGWEEYFTTSELQHLNKVLEVVEKDRSSYVVYPAQQHLLRIYEKVKLTDINVVIIGQDPYHDGNANGYAFGCQNHISPSLRELVKSWQKYRNIEICNDASKNLEYLVKQGVFLLNMILSVRYNKPFSHANYIGWEQFTEATIRHIITNNKTGVVWILLGNHAKKYYELIQKYKNSNNFMHQILSAKHPDCAVRNHIDWDSTVFYDCNNLLNNFKKPSIQWI